MMTIILTAAIAGLFGYLIYPSWADFHATLRAGQGGRHRNSGLPRMTRSGTYPRRRLESIR